MDSQLNPHTVKPIVGPSLDSLKRPTRKADDGFLFEVEPDWKDQWWGMPEFTMGDATPQFRVTMNFLTLEDLKDFCTRLGISLGPKSDTAWFPPQRLDEPKEWSYVEN